MKGWMRVENGGMKGGRVQWVKRLSMRARLHELWLHHPPVVPALRGGRM